MRGREHLLRLPPVNYSYHDLVGTGVLMVFESVPAALRSVFSPLDLIRWGSLFGIRFSFELPHISTL